jgi:hypothetical protein
VPPATTIATLPTVPKGVLSDSKFASAAAAATTASLTTMLKSDLSESKSASAAPAAARTILPTVPKSGLFDSKIAPAASATQPAPAPVLTPAAPPASGLLGSKYATPAAVSTPLPALNTALPTWNPAPPSSQPLASPLFAPSPDTSSMAPADNIFAKYEQKGKVKEGGGEKGNAQVMESKWTVSPTSGPAARGSRSDSSGRGGIARGGGRGGGGPGRGFFRGTTRMRGEKGSKPCVLEGIMNGERGRC